MSTTSTTGTTGPTAAARPTATWARPLFGLNALAAWISLGIQFWLSAAGVYPYTPTSPSTLGWNQPGAAGAVGRILDYFSYFTILSNIVVAVIMTMLWLRPDTATYVRRVLRLDALLMITITGLVYAIVLAPISNPQGWQTVANDGLHYVVPTLTVIVWLLAGPRGWLTVDLVPAALVLPVVWIVYTMLRGAVIHAYPYPFLDAVAKGYGTVAVTIAGIFVIGVVLALVLVGIDRLLSRRAG
jgi:hypothetical protein